MIVYTNGDRLVPATVNAITLQIDDESYLYVDKTTYEQAVIIDNKYRDDYDGLTKLIGVKNNLPEIDFLNTTLPAPMNILAPFLTLLEDNVKLDGTVEQLIGCLHVISRNIDFTGFLKIPAEIRRGVSFNGHITSEYELQWKEFINECIPYQMLYDVFAAQGTFANAHIPNFSGGVSAPSTAKSATDRPKPKVHYADVQPADTDDTALAAMMSDPDLLDDLLGAVDMSEFEGKKEEPAPKAEPTPAPTPTPTPTPTKSQLPEAESGKDELDSWGL